ncbi:MAG: ATP-binding cassette domain-containing protein [Bacteroidales bacterium]|nr:ATP-binding cassette domain-containing protein [Bacteroidales bacterium]MDZ4205290.1 ATP-binding cassette domain-containing protein [Bacteroidales bacterium]
MELFEAHNVSKQFSNHLALNKVNISVRNQSIFGLLGPNGAGKTTLIRIINRITGPDEGQLFFDGQPLEPWHTEQMGYLPEERGLYKKMKVGEQALYLAQLKGLSRHDAMKKLKHWFTRLELQHWWDKKVEELSKGMQQKVQFIVTVIHEPRLLIFDEPFSGFDPINVNLLKEEILRMRNDGATIIFSTHNMASVEELCDDIALINNAEKILDGKVSDIRQQYKSNIFEVTCNSLNGNLHQLLQPGYSIVDSAETDSLHRYRIQVPQNTPPNALLQNLIPHVEVHSFNEILPSMNDIFIHKVNETNRANKRTNNEE